MASIWKDLPKFMYTGLPVLNKWHLKNDFVDITVAYSLIPFITLIVLTVRPLQTQFRQPFSMHLKLNMKMSYLLKIWRHMAGVLCALKVYGIARSILIQREPHLCEYTIISWLDKVLTKWAKKAEMLKLICLMRCKWGDFRFLLICAQSMWHQVGILKTL